MARRTSIPNDLKDRYFFIDYLRLHRFGKRNGVWKKNRNMLVKEHEYDRDASTRARKGYKSYIQRCMKSILDYMYPDFLIIKPRNTFGYEIGEKNDDNRDFLDMSKPEDKIKLMIAAYLEGGNFSPEIRAYRDAVLSANRITFKNREAGLKINLDSERSFGNEAIKELVPIRAAQDNLLAAAGDGTPIWKAFLAQGLVRAIKLSVDTRVREVSRSNANPRTGIITNIEEGRRSTYSYGSSSPTSYGVQWDGPNGRLQSRRSDQIAPLFSTAEETVAMPEESTSPLMDRIIAEANGMVETSQGLTAETIFSLAKGTVVRELLAEGDMHTATIIRRLAPDADVLARITVVEQDDGDEDYEEEVA